MGQKKLGKEDPGLIRAMASMGGGIASTGGPCGAMLGAVAFLGNILGKDEPDKKDD
ncbi:MAG: C_GCAxxG_C_C family protein, partial [Deltaproteobacteria bacterium]|nr:C_GCAxxG_C_C family protein [Deltaproteobacteria bacterium]